MSYPRTAEHRNKQFARNLLKYNFNATRAAREVWPNQTYGSIRVTAHHKLTDPNVIRVMAQELAEIMTAAEVKQRLSGFARGDKDALTLKSLELMARVNAMLTDKTDNVNRNMDLTGESMKKAAEDAVQKLLSDQGAHVASP